MGNAIMKCFCLQPVSNPVHDKEARDNIDAFMAAYKNGNGNGNLNIKNGNVNIKDESENGNEDVNKSVKTS